jgi:Arc/MetJ family transcription regulator
MSRLSVSVDPRLLEKARALSGARTKTEAIGIALREYVRHAQLARLARLRDSDAVSIDVEDLRRIRRLAVEGQ